MKNFFFWLTVLLLVVATSWSLVHPGFFRVHDYVHAARVGEMLLGLQDGQLPVRWSENFGYGYGMPLFEFYAPLPFYVGAALFWLNLDVVVVLKILYLISSLFTAIGAYYLGKTLFGRTGAVVTAAAYTLAPYRAVNLFVRGALSEAWAMMAMPWVLLGIVLIVQRKRNGFWILLASLAVLMLSHNLTTLMFVPISVLFALSYWLTYHWKTLRSSEVRQHLRQLVTGAGAYILSIGLAAFYLFPALTENSFTKIQQIFSGYFHYDNHFLYIRQFITPFWGYGGSSWGPDDSISFFFGYGQLLGLALFVLAFLASLLKKRLDKRTAVFYVSIAAFFALSCFMTLLRSKFLWDSLPLLSTIQFPWRWLSVASLMIALLGGAGVALVQLKRARLLLAAVLTAVLFIANTQYFRPENYMDSPHDLYYTDPDKIQREMSQILPDYIPASMSDELVPPTEKFLVPTGTEDKVELVVDRSDQKLFKTSFHSPVVFNPMIASYPGWVVEIDGKSIEWGRGEHGTIAFTVPEGEHLVGVYFGRTPVRAISDTITVLSIIGVLGVATYVSRSNTHRSRS